MECDADIRKNSYANFMPSVGLGVFQGIVERVTKESTVLAPSTMNFPVAAPPECRGVQMSLRSAETGFFPFHKCEQIFEVPKTHQVCTPNCYCKEC